MPEIPNRDEMEAEFVAKFGRVARRHMHEFRLHLGDPPDIANVPDEFWERMKRESEHAVYPFLLFIFGESARFHGWDDLSMGLAAFGFAAEQSQAFADRWTTATRNRIANGLQKIQDRQRNAQWQTDETIEQHRESNRTLPRTHPGARPGPHEDVDEDLRDLLDKTFGPNRIERDVIIETTQARSAGGEAGIEATSGLSEQDIWCNPDDDSTCEVCRPLIGKTRSFWIQFAPKGPPPTTSECRCRCGISYEADRIADGVTAVGDWGPMEWARYWRNPESKRNDKKSYNASEPRDEHGRWVASSHVAHQERVRAAIESTPGYQLARRHEQSLASTGAGKKDRFQAIRAELTDHYSAIALNVVRDNPSLKLRPNAVARMGKRFAGYVADDVRSGSVTPATIEFAFQQTAYDALGDRISDKPDSPEMRALERAFLGTERDPAHRALRETGLGNMSPLEKEAWHAGGSVMNRKRMV